MTVGPLRSRLPPPLPPLPKHIRLQASTHGSAHAYSSNFDLNELRIGPGARSQPSQGYIPARDVTQALFPPSSIQSFNNNSVLIIVGEISSSSLGNKALVPLHISYQLIGFTQRPLLSSQMTAVASWASSEATTRQQTLSWMNATSAFTPCRCALSPRLNRNHVSSSNKMLYMQSGPK